MTTTSRTFAVGGMTCDGCVRSVTNAVTQVTGVRRVDVSLQKKAATVEFDALATTPERIVKAIEAAGFEARAA